MVNPIGAPLSRYESEQLPNYRPANAKTTPVPSVSKSPLCHISVYRYLVFQAIFPMNRHNGS